MSKGFFFYPNTQTHTHTYLKIRVTEKKRQRFFNSWFTLQMAIKAKAGPGWSWEQEFHLILLHSWTSSAAFKGISRELGGQEVEQLRFEPGSLQHADVADSDFTHDSTGPKRQRVLRETFPLHFDWLYCFVVLFLIVETEDRVFGSLPCWFSYLILA